MIGKFNRHSGRIKLIAKLKRDIETKWPSISKGFGPAKVFHGRRFLDYVAVQPGAITRKRNRPLPR
ncbi:hypothetical protein RBSWK_01743 [Rhodopirellula baltica SWK14]|uniref:Uncharacterized protein n=1 Tax=Rhodopirellula baltica SWK14 TaxID=993516 RepID=L7CJD3_RHOBT|nr:hypothetical protein RBSWK_01743 [Rhodopirellula baltica SWK14]